MKIIIDVAHGKNVSGKCSPIIGDEYNEYPNVINNRFREWKWSRDIGLKLSLRLDALSIANEFVIAPNDENECGLKQRRILTNTIANSTHGSCLMLSIHANAFGNGEDFQKPRGFSVWTSIGKTKSDGYATIIYNSVKGIADSFPMRQEYSDNDVDYESNFYVLMCKCPAVMLEVAFYTNLDDLKLLIDEEFNDKLVERLVEAIEMME